MESTYVQDDILSLIREEKNCMTAIVVWERENMENKILSYEISFHAM